MCAPFWLAASGGEECEGWRVCLAVKHFSQRSYFYQTKKSYARWLLTTQCSITRSFPDMVWSNFALSPPRSLMLFCFRFLSFCYFSFLCLNAVHSLCPLGCNGISISNLYFLLITLLIFLPYLTMRHIFPLPFFFLFFPYFIFLLHVFYFFEYVCLHF